MELILLHMSTAQANTHRQTVCMVAHIELRFCFILFLNRSSALIRSFALSNKAIVVRYKSALFIPQRTTITHIHTQCVRVCVCSALVRLCFKCMWYLLMHTHTQTHLYDHDVCCRGRWEVEREPVVIQLCVKHSLPAFEMCAWNSWTFDESVAK